MVDVLIETESKQWNDSVMEFLFLKKQKLLRKFLLLGLIIRMLSIVP